MSRGVGVGRSSQLRKAEVKAYLVHGDDAVAVAPVAAAASIVVGTLAARPVALAPCPFVLEQVAVRRGEQAETLSRKECGALSQNREVALKRLVNTQLNSSVVGASTFVDQLIIS